MEEEIKVKTTSIVTKQIDNQNQVNETNITEEISKEKITDKEIHSIFMSVEARLIAYKDSGFKRNFTYWIQKLLLDTFQHNEFVEIRRELRYTQKNMPDNTDEINKLKSKIYNLSPKKYPKDLHKGAIVNVNFGFGYCSEMRSNHYAVLLTDYKNDMYLVAPITSQRPSDDEIIFEIDTKDLPSKDGNIETGYIIFNQIGYKHYRRIETIGRNTIRYLDSEIVQDIINIYKNTF